jgi:hypothetical protein
MDSRLIGLIGKHIRRKNRIKFYIELKPETKQQQQQQKNVSKVKNFTTKTFFSFKIYK